MKTSILIIIALVTTLFSCNKGGRENNDAHNGHEIPKENKKDSVNQIIYYCPMDTQIVQNKPGTCPICEMDLEPKPIAHANDSMNHEDWVYTPVNVSVLSSIASVKPALKAVPVNLKVSGYISYDERRIYAISAKIGGRIENLFVKYNFQPIKKGQALFEIFSHDLQTAQEEYLYLKRNDPAATDLITSAKRKLLLLGMTERQINTINEGDHVHATTTVYSPFNGFVIEEKRNKEVFNSGEPMDNNSGIDSPLKMNEPDKEISLREGAYVNKGEAVFKIVNTDIVWAIFEVYAEQLIQIKMNQSIDIKLENTDEMIMGKINFIEPAYKTESGKAKFRVYLDNKNHKLKIGNLLSGQVMAGSKKGLWIPSNALLDLGKEKIVFIKREGAFETKKITTGAESGNEVEVTNGLSEDDEIAGNAQFLIDSESFIKVTK